MKRQSLQENRDRKVSRQMFRAVTETYLILLGNLPVISIVNFSDNFPVFLIDFGCLLLRVVIQKTGLQGRTRKDTCLPLGRGSGLLGH